MRGGGTPKTAAGNVTIVAKLERMRALADNALSIFTDGSSRQGPRRGGVAWRFVWTDEDGHERTYEDETASWPGATNNEMELQAVIEALKLATGRSPIVDPSGYERIDLLTDSAYVAENYPRALHQWSTNGWKLAGGAPPENLGQWRDLVTLVRRADRAFKRLRVEQIPRRSDEHSRRVDNLAKRSSKSPLAVARPLRPRHVARKLSRNTLQRGSVPAECQTEKIRIIGCWVIGSPHPGYRYKYEVLEGANRQLIDLATSREVMHRTHCYLVRLNYNPGNPQIVEVVGEVVPDDVKAEAASSGETP